MEQTAIVFAGQGAQYAGMGRDLAAAYPVCRDLYERAGLVLGYDLGDLCFGDNLEALTRTDRCQPAIFVTSVACAAAWRQKWPGHDVMATAGLSLGEWTALYEAGVLEFEDAVRLLEARGRFMQEACDAVPGGMVSVIGLTFAQVQEICDRTGVEMSNINSPAQIVVSGALADVERAAAAAADAGAKRAIPLQVAGAYHSRLMAGAAERLREALAGVELRAPRLPVLSNVTGEPHGEPDTIRENLVAQVVSPVQWLKTIEWCGRAGVQRYLECGPGKVLAGLIKRIDKQAIVHSIQDGDTLRSYGAA